MNSDKTKLSELADDILELVKAAQAPEGNLDELNQKLDDEQDGWEAAILAATTARYDGHEVDSAFIDRLLAAKIRDGAPLEKVAGVYNRLPRETSALHATAVEVAGRGVFRAEELKRDDTHPLDYLTALNNFVARLLQIRDMHRADEFSSKAVAFSENSPRSMELEEERVDALDHRSSFLRSLGRNDEALELVTAACQLVRSLLETNSEKYKRQLAISLNNMAGLLHIFGRDAEALTAIEESVSIFEELAAFATGVIASPTLQTWIDDARPDLATARIVYASSLCKVGRFEEAFEAARAAGDYFYSQLEENPDTFQSLFSMALNNQAMALDRLGRFRDSLDIVDDALERYRSLSSVRNEIYGQFYAHLLTSKTVALVQLDEADDTLDEALTTADEAIAVYATLPEEQQIALANKVASALQHRECIIDEVYRQHGTMVFRDNARLKELSLEEREGIGRFYGRFVGRSVGANAQAADVYNKMRAAFLRGDLATFFSTASLDGDSDRVSYAEPGFLFNLGQTVVLTHDRKRVGLTSRDVGVIWAFYSMDPKFYEARFRDSSGIAFDLTVEEDEIQLAGPSG